MNLPLSISPQELTKSHVPSYQYLQLIDDESQLDFSTTNEEEATDFSYYDANEFIIGYQYADYYASDDCSGSPLYEVGYATSTCINIYAHRISTRYVVFAGILFI
jgi:hypothetical protein